MAGLDGTLGDYVGVGMAAMILGRSPEQTGAIYELINTENIKTWKLGGMTLMKYDDFVDAAKSLYDTSGWRPLWPKELAVLPMGDLYSRQTMAATLGVSIGTVHRMARKGEITAIDLSEWNMNSLYYYVDYDKEQLIVPITVNAWGNDVKLDLVEGQLHVHIWPVGNNKLKSAGFLLEPSKAWFVDDKIEDVYIIVQVHQRKNA